MSLDKTDFGKFPGCVQEGLRKLEEIMKLPSNTHIHKLQQKIIEENVFMLQDTTKCPKIIDPLEELVLVRTIAEYMAHVVDSGVRNILFISLFPVVTNDSHSGVKNRVLSCLISLAIATHNVAVLDATAVWMQQVSCFSTRCCRVSFGLVQDFFHQSNETPAHFSKALNALPTATPLFTAHLITSLAHVYAKVETIELCEEPPSQVVDIVNSWLKKYPEIVLAPLTTALPGISLPMVAVLAVAPLAKWCIESPFFPSRKNISCSQDSFSELHLALLQILQRVASIKAPITRCEVVNAEHLKNIAESLKLRLEDPTAPESAKETASNRLAQLILVALHTECLSGRDVEMWHSLMKLPSQTRLMKTLLNRSGIR